MVRDLGRSLGKQVNLEIVGRDDPGRPRHPGKARGAARPSSAQRRRPRHRAARGAPGAGKPAEGSVRLEARHSAGTLQIIVADDGRGIDLERLREAVFARRLSNAETAARLSEAELLEFLFLPGFTLKTGSPRSPDAALAWTLYRQW